MKVNDVTRWIKLDYEATSLYSVIADGVFRPTTAGRDKWKSLITGSSLQLKCNKEGFNFRDGPRYMRIGLAANEYNYCISCDSWIGFGAFFTSSITTGNFAAIGGDQGDRNTPVIGYVLVS